MINSMDSISKGRPATVHEQEHLSLMILGDFVWQLEIGFGTVQVLSNVLTYGPSINPTTIGLEHRQTEHLHQLHLTEGNGTLAVQGQFAMNIWPRELALVGGTRLSQFASGYDISEIIDDSNPADDVTIHEIHLKFL
ncbi:hypothetical protein R1sor_009794 [Riccia sorocarpa]|uniref:Dirigent protein n=1 Tax=Riccia sorocarpa TaxID=122646 RepID=A0ABD3HW38_9MARC